MMCGYLLEKHIEANYFKFEENNETKQNIHQILPWIIFMEFTQLLN